MTRKAESSGSTPDRLEFRYDYLGRRAQKTVYDHRTSGSVLRNVSYVWNGWSLVAELDAASSHALLRSYLWGRDFSTGGASAGGAGGLLSVREGSAVYYPVYDPMGNVTGYVTDNTAGGGSGAIAARYEYNAYGEIQAPAEPSEAFAFGFATQYTDRETGLVYYGLRYYNPRHGRFVNRDPIGEAGGLNLYSFVGNNPAMRHDTLGLAWECTKWSIEGQAGVSHEVDGKTVTDYQIAKVCHDQRWVDDGSIYVLQVLFPGERKRMGSLSSDRGSGGESSFGGVGSVVRGFVGMARRLMGYDGGSGTGELGEIEVVELNPRTEIGLSAGKCGRR